MAFEQKPQSAPAKVNKVEGEYRTMLIEKHDKESDMRHMFGVYKKALGGNIEVVSTTDEGITIKFPAEVAEAAKAKAIAEANRRTNRLNDVTPDKHYQGITEVSSNTVENVSVEELIGSK